MCSRYRILQEDDAHFVTGTIVAWLPLFTTGARCDILVQALDYCRAQRPSRSTPGSSSIIISTLS
jgi:hypothetical protein